MRRLVISKGDRYGKLTVVGEASTRHTPSGQAKRNIQCVCDCGNTSVVPLTNLRSKCHPTLTCGKCEKGQWNATHRMGGTRVHRVWTNMRSRCHNKNVRSYKDYGGRGIAVCKRWDSFELFLSDMGQPPSDSHQIDRINNDGDYEPCNCRWVTQAENKQDKRNTVRVCVNGSVYRIPELAAEYGVKECTIRRRMEKGWSGVALVSSPYSLRGKV